jgi:peptidoglycan/LPS O-acetylase OafA/YrhL
LNPDDLLTTSAAIATVVLLLWTIHALPTGLVLPLLPTQAGTIPRPRVAAIDGLRAFLALGVVFMHAWAFHDTYFVEKTFELPHNPYLSESGVLAVLVFFMITGFLFWNKAIAARGRVNPFRLYRNRARRILPLYYFLCGCTLLVVLVRAGVRINEPVGVWSREMAGLIVPGLRTTGDLLGTERKVMIAQSWTLYYEDLFYLALPAFGLAARSRRSGLAFVFVVLLLLVISRVEIHRYD